MKFSLPIISFMGCIFSVVSKKSSTYSRTSTFSLILCSMSFKIFHFTFISVIHFELIFVKGIRSDVQIHFLHMGGQLFQLHLLKRLFLHHCTAFAPVKHQCVGLFLGSFCPIDLLFHQHHTVLTTIALQCFEVGQRQYFIFVLSPQYGVGYQGSFVFSPHELQNQFGSPHIDVVKSSA